MIATKLARCRVCGSDDLHVDRELASFAAKGTNVTFYACLNCGTVMDPAMSTPDYASEDAAAFSAPHYLRHYLETGAGIHFMTRAMQLLRSARPQRHNGDPLRFLDVGAGMGLCVDMARQFGWEAIGVEPSRGGEVGRDMLGVKMISGYLEKGTLPANSFDLILSSEVIEHVTHPDQFVQLIAGYLAPGGALVLSTPNSRAVADRSLGEMEWLEVYNPGYHYTLFSPASLEDLLRRNGFADVRVITLEGSSGQKRLVAMASKQQGVVPADLRALLTDEVLDRRMVAYLESVLARRDRADCRDEWYWGAAYRLFERHINRGDFAPASRCADTIDAYFQARGLTPPVLAALQATSLLDYLDQVPAFSGTYAYYRGILALNHAQDWALAQSWFRVAHHLCCLQEKLAFFYLGHFAIRARFHEGVALFRAGQRGAAIAIFDELLRRADGLPPDVLPRINWERAVAHLQLGDNNAAIAQFAELLLEQVDVVRPEMRGPLKHLLLACLQKADVLQQEICNRNSQANNLSHTIVSAIDKAAQGVQAGNDCLSQLAARGKDLSLRTEEAIGVLTEAARGMQQTVRFGEQSAKELLARAEKTLAVVAETAQMAQHLAQSSQQQGKQVLVRAEETMAALADTARALQPAIHCLDRALAIAGAVFSLPRRAWHKATGVFHRHGRRLSVRDLERTSTAEIEKRVPLGEIVSGTTIEQTVRAEQDQLCRVSLMIGTHRRMNTCHLLVSILDKRWGTLHEVSRSAAEFVDNQYSTFFFPPLAASKGKKFRVRISSPDGCPGSAVTLWARVVPRRRGLTYNGATVVDAEAIVELGYQQQAAAPGDLADAERDILIVTPDRLGKTRIGLGMRHWEIAEALSKAGLKVTLGSTQPIAADLDQAEFRVAQLSALGDEARNLARSHTVIMVQGNVLNECPSLLESKRPVIADMVTPFHIENVQTSQEQYVNSLAVINNCLHAADFFVCGNERQRLYWLGMLTAFGRIGKAERDLDHEFRQLIDVVGFGISDEEPRKVRPVLKGVHPRIGKDDFLLIWFGGIWDWLDPMPLIRAVHAAQRAEPRIKLFFSMYRKNNEQPTKTAVRARELSRELGALDQCIFFNELPIPYDERADYLLESDLGVMVQPQNFETQISARTRALDYLWADLPLLANKGDEISELVSQHEIGVVTENNAADELEEALLKYVRDDLRRQRAVAGIRRLKRNMRWSNTVRPILDFCKAVRGRR